MKNDIYQLEISDNIWGNKGRRISGEVYDLLPENVKNKFKLISKGYRTIGDLNIAFANPGEVPMPATVPDVWDGDFEDEIDEDDDE